MNRPQRPLLLAAGATALLAVGLGVTGCDGTSEKTSSKPSPQASSASASSPTDAPSPPTASGPEVKVDAFTMNLLGEEALADEGGSRPWQIRASQTQTTSTTTVGAGNLLTVSITSRPFVAGKTLEQDAQGNISSEVSTSKVTRLPDRTVGGEPAWAYAVDNEEEQTLVVGGLHESNEWMIRFGYDPGWPSAQQRFDELLSSVRLA